VSIDDKEDRGRILRRLVRLVRVPVMLLTLRRLINELKSDSKVDINEAVLTEPLPPTDPPNNPPNNPPIVTLPDPDAEPPPTLPPADPPNNPPIVILPDPDPDVELPTALNIFSISVMTACETVDI